MGPIVEPMALTKLGALSQGWSGYSRSAMKAAMRPPLRKVRYFGATLAKSKAGLTKLATTLMPRVATAKVRAASRTRNVLSNLAEISAGSRMTLPYTLLAAAVVIAATREKRI